MSIREEPDPQHPEQGTGNINFDLFVYLTAFQESFKARWQEGERSYGRLNPMYYYGGTNRTADMSFTLPAITVQDSRNNLSNCSELSRAVYGRYKKWDGTNDFTLTGHRYFRVSFGSLIRNERAFIGAFEFTTNQDAGVFDHSAGDDTDVTHKAQRVVLPKQIDVRISIIFKHDYPLGFAGPWLASSDRTRWAPNNGKDFPHGTGTRTVQPYMEPAGGTQAVRTSRTDDERQEHLFRYANEQIAATNALLIEEAADSGGADADAIAMLNEQKRQYQAFIDNYENPSDTTDIIVDENAP